MHVLSAAFQREPASDTEREESDHEVSGSVWKLRESNNLQF